MSLKPVVMMAWMMRMCVSHSMRMTLMDKECVCPSVASPLGSLVAVPRLLDSCAITTTTTTTTKHRKGRGGCNWS